MNIDKLESDGKISKVKLLHDCAGTLRTAAALKNSLDKSAASVTKKASGTAKCTAAGFAGHKCNGDIV